jgi:hypothetical protein
VFSLAGLLDRRRRRYRCYLCRPLHSVLVCPFLLFSRVLMLLRLLILRLSLPLGSLTQRAHSNACACARARARECASVCVFVCVGGEVQGGLKE